MQVAKVFYTLAFTATLFGCGTGSEAAKNSETKWAHQATANAIAIINSRVQFLDLKFKTDFSNIAICIQGSPTYNDQSLLLETKLAYAAWYEASGQASSNGWNHFVFDLKPSCNMRDNSYSSIVVISDSARITPDQEIDKTFAKNKVSCKRVGFSASCNTGSMTMGLGGSGSIGYRYFKPETWESVMNRSPATVLLSPFVEWTSMEKELGTLAPLYKDLRSRAESVSFEELKALNAAIAERKLKIADDNRLGTLVKEFLDSNQSSSVQLYTPVMPGYHVLLHEVGHQFGMDHADNPSGSSETGKSEGATLNSDGSWSTPLSTMAYADEYLYLTPDDRSGILDLATKSSALVKSRRGL